MSFFGKYYYSSTHAVGEGGESLNDFLRMRGKPGRDAWVPAADLYEADGGYMVVMELAGVSADDIEIHVTGSNLCIRGIRTEAKSKRRKVSYRQMEIPYGPFERLLKLPGPVAAEGTKARMKEGMLEVFLPHAKPSATPPAFIRIEWEITE